MSKHSKSYREPSHEEIAIRAQGIYEREGRPQGRATQHWLQAEAQLIAERKAEAEASAKTQSKQSSAPGNKMRGNDWQTTGRPTMHTN